MLPSCFSYTISLLKDRLTDFIHLFPFSTLTELLTICLLRYDRSFFTSMTFSSSPSPSFHLCLHHLGPSFHLCLHHFLFNFVSVISSTGASAENLGLYRLHSGETFRRYPYCCYGKFAYSECIKSGDTTFLSFFVEI